MDHAMILFANGLEECEGLLVVDLLRRAGIEIDVVSVEDSTEVVSSHGIRIGCDSRMTDIKFEDYSMMILPGGMPGTMTLRNNDLILAQVREFYESGRRVAAICAAPSILAKAGILDGKKATVHPNFKSDMGNAELLDEEVVVDGRITTGWGLGAGIPFGLELVRQLCGEEKSSAIRDKIGYIH